MSTERRYLMLGGDIAVHCRFSLRSRTARAHGGPSEEGRPTHQQLFMQEHCKNARYSPINYLGRTDTN